LLAAWRRRTRRDPEDPERPDTRSPEPELLLAADGAAGAAALFTPPLLSPSAIFRQVLWDPAEVAPTWAQPKTTPEPGAAVEPIPQPAALPATGDGVAPAAARPKRTRQPKAAGSSSAKPPPPSRTRKRKGDAAGA